MEAALNLIKKMTDDANRSLLAQLQTKQRGPLRLSPAVTIPLGRNALILKSQFDHPIASFQVIEEGLLCSTAEFAARDEKRTMNHWMARFPYDGTPFHFLITNHTPLPLTFQLEKVEKGLTSTVNKVNTLRPFECVELDTDDDTQSKFVFSCVKGWGGETQCVAFGDATGKSEATQFRLKVSNARDLKRQVIDDFELAFCSSEKGIARWECDSTMNMVIADVPPLKKMQGGGDGRPMMKMRRGVDVCDADQVGYGAHGREEADSDSAKDDNLGKLTKGKFNFVHTVEVDDILTLQETLSPVCSFGFSLMV